MKPKPPASTRPLPPLPPDLVAIRARFESAWQQARLGELRPRIEDYLGGIVGEERIALLQELIAVDLVYRGQGGERPGMDEYQSRFSELNEDWLVWACGGSAGESNPTRSPSEGTVQEPGAFRCPHCHNPIRLADPRDEEVLCPGCGGSFLVRDARLTATVSTSRPLGKFLLMERVGQGAFGAVWKARDGVLDRVVALKIPHAGLLADAEELERFHREARAAAQLRHPGIVTVHEVETLGGLPVIVSDFVQGVTLKDYLEVHRLTAREAAELVSQLADALDYAHAMGLVHRDIKPANVMIEHVPASSDGGTASPLGRPLLMDFGLALRGEAEVTLTLEGHVIGTPAYMSPEQAAGKSHHADRRSDIYSLGVVLYELLTGELPFRGSKGMLLYQVLHEEPRPPRKVNTKIPCDLERVCLKCLNKAPAARYATAAELAADLRRYLAGEPVRARPVGALERWSRWARQRPALVAVYALLVLVLALGTAGGGAAWLWLGAEHAREEATRARDDLAEEKRQTEMALREAERARESEAGARRREAEAREELEQVLYLRRVSGALAEWQEHGIERAQQLLDECPPHRRNWEWHYVSRLCKVNLATLAGHEDTVYAVAFSPDGKRLASAGADGRVRIWDAETGKELRSLPGHPAGAFGIAFRPDGKRLATVGADHTARVWDLETGKCDLVLKGHSDTVYGVAFSPDGKRLATAAADQTVRLWDAETGKEGVVARGHTDRVSTVAFSPDGKHLASAGEDRTVRVWNAEDGKEARVIKGHRDAVLSLAFRPDGKRLASAGADGLVRICDAGTGNEVLRLEGHRDWVNGVAFSPDGKRLASASADKVVRLWDAETGKEELVLKGHNDTVYSVAFSPDGKRLASASADRTLRLFDVNTGRKALVLEGHDRWVLSVACNPAGEGLVSGSQDGTVRLWDIARSREIRALKGEQTLVFSVAFSPDGKRVASASADKTVRIWEAETGKEGPVAHGHTDAVYSVAFSPGGKRLASGGADGMVRVWDADSGKEVQELKGHIKGVFSVAFSPTGKRIASAGADGVVRVWDAEAGKQVLTLEGHRDWINTVAFSPDGRRIASAGEDRVVRVWDAETGKQVFALAGHTDTIDSAAFSPDGKRLASGGEDETLRVWDVESGKEALVLKGHRNRVLSVAFSPDGKWLVSAGADRTVRLWQGGSATQPATPPEPGKP